MKIRLISALLFTFLCAALIVGCQQDQAVQPQAIEISSINLELGDTLQVNCDGQLGLDLDDISSGQLFCNVLVETATSTSTAVVETETSLPVDTATITPTDTSTITPTATDTLTPTSTITPLPTTTAILTPTSTSTSAHSPLPTNTATLTTTNTPIPPTSTSTKVPTVAPPAGTPSASTPLCVHNPTKWHGMYDSASNCRYDHHHGDNPQDLTQCDPLLTQWFGALPTAISYEWQTPNENTLKHNGYINLCRVFARPGGTEKLANNLNWMGSTPIAVAGVFLQIHRHAGRMDRVAPLHSYRLWSYSCSVVNGAIDWSKCGTFKTGGWSHLGIFHCIYKQERCARPNDWPVASNHWIPGTDTSGKTIDPYIAIIRPINETLTKLSGNPSAWSTSGVLREDNNADVGDLWTTGAGIYGADATGRGYNWNAGYAALSTDDPDSVNVNAYKTAIAAGSTITAAYDLLNVSICDYAPVGQFCRFDGSEHAIFTAYTLTPYWWDGASFDTDSRSGFISANIYTDLRGNPKISCAGVGATCVPLILESSPVGWSGWNAATSEQPNGKIPGNLREYNPYNLPIIHHIH